MKSSARPGSSFFVIAAVAIGVGGLVVGGCGGRSLLMPKADGGGAGQGSGAAGTQGSAGTGSSGTAGTTGAAGSGAGTAGTTGTAGTSTGAAGSTSSGSAGSTSSGSAGSTSSGSAGSGSAGTVGTAGQGGHGGSAACGPCPSPDCKMGFMSVVDPTVSCCPVCRPINCATVDCAAPPCPDGHLETPDGQCCPICVMGPPLACSKGLKEYTVNRENFLDKYGMTGCMTDKDCTLFFENNACARGCGTPIALSIEPTLESNLNNVASMECNTCPPPPVPPCAQFVALCSNGMCVRGSPPLR